MLTTVVPAMTPDHIRYYETVIADAQGALLQPVQKLFGNPEKIEFYHRQYSRAHTMGRLPEQALLNMAYLPSFEPSSELDQLLGFFDDQVVPPRLRVIPDGFCRAAARHLQRARLTQTGFDTVLHGAPQVSEQPLYPEVEVLPAHKKEPFEESLKILYGSDGQHDRTVLDMLAIGRSWIGLENYRFYLAMVQDQPAAAAMMYLGDGVAYFSQAATLPEFQEMGCHQALVQAGILEATQAGSEIIMATAPFESQARFNFEVMGLSVAYLAAIWERL